MQRGFDITHTPVEVDASRLRVHGEEYAAALARLRERGAGGASWGDDGLMSGLVSTYFRSVTAALDTYSHMGSVISGTGDGMSAASRRVSSVEEDMTRHVNDLDGGAGTTWV
ncbi:hypothetical protein [Sphaerisporangium aureirubrum]|uniref:WXG100 family type VII secretion target n=1 Tax=Sphaerisporangium aureirubrum TaxID=1544736 RepID=A0ABW1NJH9_9ACTN